MRYVFLINPAAGINQKYLEIIPKIEKYFSKNGGDYKILFSSEKGDALKKARAEALKNDEVLIFSCGGEGTCFEILNGIIGFDNVTLTEIPTGCGNDFLKSFGAESHNDFLDIEQLINGTTVKMDVIKADEYYCLNGCSVGMDAVVARDMNIFKKWPFVSGPFAYKLAAAKTFFGKIGTVLDIKINGLHKYKKNCLFAVIGNGKAYGGSYYATPKAIPFDKELDFTVVETVSRLKILKFLKTYERGKHENLPFCDMGRCNSMSFKSDKKVPVNLDGEIIERNEMNFEIVKECIKFRLPKSIALKNGIKSKMLTNCS